MPRVSVIVPTCNRPELLICAIRSIISQDFADFEIIVVDDGQKKSARDAVKQISDPRLRYLANEKSLGGSGSRNRGIRESKARLIAFLDDDDEWLPGKLKKQVRALQDLGSDVGFCFTGVLNVFDDREVVVHVSEGLKDYHELSLTRFKGFLTSTLLVKKEVFEKVGGFDESFPSHQEAELMIRITQRYKGFGIDKPLVRMNVQTGHEHVGSSLMRRIAGREKIISKHLVEYKKRPSVLSTQYFRLALLYRQIRRLQDASHKFRLSFITKFSFRPFFHYLNLMPRVLFMNIKSFIVSVLEPKHFGTLVREKYFYYFFHRLPLDVSNPKQIFDAGCGRGQYASRLAQFFPEANVLGGDIVEAPEWSLYDLPNLRFEKNDLSVFHKPNSYDLITSVDVLEHIKNNEKVMMEFYNALKPGGYLYLAVPCEKTEVQIFPRSWFGDFHDWEKDEHIGEQYTLTELIEKLGKMGFKIKTSRYTFTFWGILGWGIEFMLRGKKWGNRLNLLLMPLYKILCFLDIHLPIGTGNNLIIAKKE